jgi:hypothetical protein
VVLFWLLQSLRYRSLTLPSLANPRIAAGGICGESKNQILGLAGPKARPWVADYVALTTLGHGEAGDLPRALAALRAAGLRFPLVAKPDMSCNGVGVRVVRDETQLAAYLAAFPRGAGLQLQALVEYPGEAGIFYIRHPGEAQGRITSVTLNFPPVVVGDGRRSVKALIAADDRLNAISHLLLPKLGSRAASIPAPGERVALVFVGNHCRGATFRNGQHEITPALTACIDRIAHAIPDFHFGRFDLRFASIPALREGKDFRIIEVNGVGSEATHIWDPNTTLREAYAVQFAHYRAAFEVGRANRARGHRPTGLLDLLQAWRRQRRLLASYPLND